MDPSIDILLEVQGNDLMLSIFKKSQKRNKKASGSEQTVGLVLTIRRAIVVVVLGLYGGLERSHCH